MKKINKKNGSISVEEDRLLKLEELIKLEVDPYPPTLKYKKESISKAVEKEGKQTVVVGRILGWRAHGSVIFADLMDETGKMQLFFQKKNIEGNFYILKLVDVGDFILAKGQVIKTVAGEISVDVKDFQILTKTLKPLPPQWHGLKDVEERYRKRYLDTILNEEVKNRLLVRSKIVDSVRDFLTDRGFVEVETPTLQPVYGGGFARPFSTHHNALDSDFYLRISDEMYLKRLIVGGFEKVFEITKVFRNEGIDFDHNPEFTMFEAQIAYEDYAYGMDLIEEIFEYTANRVLGKTKVDYQGNIIDVKRPWARYKLIESVEKFAGLKPMMWKSVADAKKEIKEAGLKKDKFKDLNKIQNMGECIAFAFEEFVEEKLIQPTFIYDYPVEVSPLAKKCVDPRFTQRFEFFAFGSELGNNYTELNDPIDLKKRFVEEKKREKAGFDEAHQTDYDYLEAIEHGFPPTCGIAIGIDRFVMLLTNAKNIKEVIAFPTLKPKVVKAKVSRSKISTVGNIVRLSDDFVTDYPSASIGYAIIQGVDIKKTDKNLEKEQELVVDTQKSLTLDNLNELKELKSYRQMYKKMGVDIGSRKPSPEALLRRIVQGKGLYKINTCVDAYNLSVINNRVSIGAFDLDQMELPISLKVASGGEIINLLGVDGDTTIKKGEVFYSDKIGPYNLDYNYRDSERTKITGNTRNIIINVDGVYEITQEKVAEVLKEVVDKILKYCGGKVVKAGVVNKDGDKKLVIK